MGDPGSICEYPETIGKLFSYKYSLEGRQVVIAINVSKGSADPKYSRMCADELHSLSCFPSRSGEIQGFLSC